MLPRVIAMLMYVTLTAVAAGQDGFVPPPGSGVLNVRDYGAVGDGVADDTEAVRKAIDALPMHSTLYLPDGVYRVTDTIEVRRRQIDNPREAWQSWVTLIGQSRDGVVIKLDDRAPGFDDSAKRKPLLRPKIGNEAFELRFINVTLDVGAGNPGAVGLVYSSANGGIVKNVLIRSSDPDGAGAVGIDQNVNSPGRAYLSDVEIVGFDVAVLLSSEVNGFGYENFVLRGQRRAGFHLLANNAGIVGLRSDNRVPAVVVDAGASLSLINAELRGGAGDASAVVNRGVMFLRNVTAQGYAAALDGADGPVASPIIEHTLGRSVSAFPTDGRSLNLPIEPVPQLPWDTGEGFARWVNVAEFGAAPDAGGDVSDAIDRAVAHARDKGAHTLWFPKGRYVVSRAIDVSGLRRVVGFNASLVADTAAKTWPHRPGRRADGSEPVVLRVGEGQPVVSIDGFASINGFIDHAAANTLVLRWGRGAYYTHSATGGRAFFEDFGTNYRVRGPQQLWVRFWDGHGIPKAPDHLPRDAGRPVYADNQGGTLWMHAVHAESKNPAVLVRTTDGGASEIISLNAGAHWDADDAAVPVSRLVNFINDEARTSVVAWHSAYRTLIEDRRGGWVRHVPTGRTPGALAVADVKRDATPPGAVGDLAAATQGQWPFLVTLTWTPAADADSGIAGYEIRRGDDEVIGHTESTQFIDEVMRDEAALTYRVTALNGAMQAGPAATATITTGKDTTPLGVESVHAMPDGQGTVLWAVFTKPVAPADANDVANYRLIDGPAIASATLNPDGRTVTLRTDAPLGYAPAVLRLHRVHDLASKPDMIEEGRSPVDRRAAGTGLLLEIFADAALGKLVASRGGSVPDHKWHGLPPAPGVADREHALRWTGQVRADVSGTHRFVLRSDETAKLTVDGRVVLDTTARREQFNTESAPIDLVAGRLTDISLVITPRSDEVTVTLDWQMPGSDEPAPLAAANLYPADRTTRDLTWAADTPGQGLAADYRGGLWSGRLGKRIARIDPVIDFDWGLGPPRPELTDDTSSVVWTGWIVPTTTGPLTFVVDIGPWDAIDLRIDGVQVIKATRRHNKPQARYTGTIQAQAGVPMPIRLHWMDKDWTADGKEASIRLMWHAEGEQPSVIPATSLYPRRLP